MNNLPKIFIIGSVCKKTQSFKSGGFTLIELLLIMASISLLGALTVPLSVRFLQGQILDETANGILETLRRAQNSAIYQKNDSAYGVAFFPGYYVLFQGNSYSSRIAGADEIFELGGNTSISGIVEVVFSKLAGAPSAVGVLIASLSSVSDSRSISISAEGKIEK
ncbi:type II secretion system protein [Candidatus Wolfebacteria bacterium]|nr:type II secretion system protein [Candidatus Wolfebacteria bacterium]